MSSRSASPALVSNRSIVALMSSRSITSNRSSSFLWRFWWSSPLFPLFLKPKLVTFFVSCVCVCAWVWVCMCVGVHVCVGVGGKINNTLDSERGRCSGTCTDLSLPHAPGHPSPSRSPHSRHLHLLQYVRV